MKDFPINSHMRSISIFFTVWCAITLPGCLSVRHAELAPSAFQFLAAVSNAVYLESANTDGTPRARICMTNGCFTTYFDPELKMGQSNYWIEKVALGDVNHDGVPDAAVVVSCETGGSGHFYDLYAVINSHGRAIPTFPIFLGDRIEIISVEILNRDIVVEFYDRFPDECMAERPTHRTFRANSKKETRERIEYENQNY